MFSSFLHLTQAFFKITVDCKSRVFCAVFFPGLKTSESCPVNLGANVTALLEEILFFGYWASVYSTIFIPNLEDV